MTKKIKYAYVFCGYKEIISEKFIPAGIDVSKDAMLMIHPNSKEGRMLKKLIKYSKRVSGREKWQ